MCSRFRFSVLLRCFCSHPPRSAEEEIVVTDDFFSPRIAELILERRSNPNMDKVESEIEASKSTWSEVSSSSTLTGEALASDNLRVFKSLRQRWPGRFFELWKEEEYEVGEKLAEGGQAELFELWLLNTPGGERNLIYPKVIKVFKEGTSLQDLQTLLPPGMLAHTRDLGLFLGGQHCNPISGAMLLNGRFAIRMDRKWGDLRKLIDARMVYFDTHYEKHGPPFSRYQTTRCMLEIAEGMRELHLRNITHSDLKAANVLVSRPTSRWGPCSHLLDPIHDQFRYEVADYECSVGVQGTGFWRAPEVLLAVKNRSVTPALFTKASDVYSFGMTCFEIITGRIPFEVEGFTGSEYQRVLDGYRPQLPEETPDWMKGLVRKCWRENPVERPTFEEAVHLLALNVP